MKFFSGFCFQNEEELFDNFLIKTDFCVAGFSYGAIKALKYTLEQSRRTDTLQLFSPAFFQDRDERFKKLQIISYRKNKESYLENFYKNAIYPRDLDIDKYKKEDSLEDLKTLLYHIWKKEDIEKVLQKGVKIEVYLGKKDSIIHSINALEFFKEFTEVYFINNGGHLL